MKNADEAKISEVTILDENESDILTNHYKLIGYTPQGIVTAQINDGPLFLQRHAIQLVREPTVLYQFNLSDIELIQALASENLNK